MKCFALNFKNQVNDLQLYNVKNVICTKPTGLKIKFNEIVLKSTVLSQTKIPLQIEEKEKMKKVNMCYHFQNPMGDVSLIETKCLIDLDLG